MIAKDGDIDIASEVAGDGDTAFPEITARANIIRNRTQITAREKKLLQHIEVTKLDIRKQRYVKSI